MSRTPRQAPCRTGRAAGLALAVVLPVLGTAPAQAQTAAGVRSGDHQGYGRIVFDLPAGTSYGVERAGDRVVLRFDGGVSVPAGAPPRNVAGVDGGEGRAEIQLLPGARHRAFRIGNRVVVDILDTSPADRPSGPERAAQAATLPPVDAEGEAPRRPARPARRQAARTPVPAQSQPAQAQPAPVQAAPVQSVSVQSAPAQTAPAQPSPLQPTSVQPAPVQRPAAQPLPAQPASVQPAPEAAPRGSAGTRTEQVLRLPGPTVPTAPPQPADPGVTTAPTVAVSQEALPAPGTDQAPSPAPASAPSPSRAAAAAPALIPAAADVGAAAFPCAASLCLVFDARVTLPPALLEGFGPLVGAQVEALPGATLLRLPSAPALRLARVEAGWQVSRPAAVSAPSSIMPKPQADGLLFPVSDPGRVVGIPDGDTGQLLLVATLRGGPAEAAVDARRTPEYALRPALLGAVVEPLSDQAALRPAQGGFLLTSAGVAGMQLPPAPPVELTRLSRRLDLPDLPEAELMRRARAATAAAAAAAPMARAKPRLEAAQALLALGLGAEAQAVAELARSEDPRAGLQPAATLVQGAAAVIAGRPAEATGLGPIGDAAAGGAGEAAADGSDEAALWRALRTLATSGDAPPADAVSALAARYELLLAYPSPLRARLLPVAAEALALGGAPEAADALLARAGSDPAAAERYGPSLAFARAIRTEQRGEADAAIQAYDALVAGPDRPTRARAALRVADLRVGSGKGAPGEAADALERSFLAWRGDGLELRMRMRAAALRAQAGAWRPALNLLKETESLYPEERPALRERMREAVLAMLRQGSTQGGPQGGAKGGFGPFELVSLAGEYADMLPEGAAGETVSALLADQLLALDLPSRARPVLEKLMAAAKGSARAALGLRLAGLRLGEGEPAAALSVLAGSDAPDLSPEVAAARRLLRARATAAGRDLPGALSLLAQADDPAADQLRVELLEAAQDWRAALSALQALTARQVPPSGKLEEAQQALLVRQAGLAARVGDSGVLRALRAELPRVAGPQADLFRLLVAEPVQGPSDLPRAAAETALARALPQASPPRGALAAAR